MSSRRSREFSPIGEGLEPRDNPAILFASAAMVGRDVLGLGLLPVPRSEVPEASNRPVILVGSNVEGLSLGSACKGAIGPVHVGPGPDDDD